MLHNSLQYLPNPREILVITLIATIIEGVIEPILNLGSNIFAKDVFRDMAKIPGSAILDHLEVNVGETKYKYDDSYEKAQYLRIGCKLAFIVPTYFGLGMAPAIAMAYIASPICEIPAQTVIRIGQLKQDTNDTSTPFLQYYIDNINNDIVIGSIIASVTKKGTAAIVASIIDLLPKTPHLYAKSGALANDRALLAMFKVNGDFIVDADTKHTCAHIVKKIYHALEETTLTTATKAIILSLAVANELILREAANIFNAYILMSAARPVQELSYSIYMKYANSTIDLATDQNNNTASNNEILSPSVHENNEYFDSESCNIAKHTYSKLLGNDTCSIGEL
jgi:hypothetical protein